MRIERFEVSEQLCRDESSVLYRARDPNLRREVTIRVLDAAREGRALDQFQKSAQALAKLRHVGIVGVHDLGIVQGCPYLVMDHVPGRSLAERVGRQGPLAPRDAAEVLRAVAEALEYAHRQGVLHRDVRPERVLLTAAGESLIGDFSLALGLEDASAGGLTTTSAVSGPRGFLAPEQVESRLDAIGPATDVYGVGATLYFALTGQPPFPQDLPGDRRPRLRPPSAIAAQVPGALDQICATALHSDPEQRYPSAALLAEDLSRFLSGRGVSRARSRSWSRALPAAGGARPLLFLGGVVGVGTALGLGAAALTQPAEAPATASAVTPSPPGSPSPGDPAGSTASPPPAATSSVPASPAKPRLTADEVERLYATAVEAARDERWEEAFRSLDALLEAEPEHVGALGWRAYAHAAAKRWQPALDDAARALLLDPGCAKALEARIMALVSTGRNHDALADVTRWIEAEPENPDTYGVRCAVLGQLGRKQEALAAIEQALRMDPNKARFHVNRALCRFQLGDPQGALEDCNQAAELFDKPRHQPFTTRGMIQRELGRHDLALADFQRGCELEPGEANNWNCLAVGLMELEQPGILEALTKAIELEPDFFDALMNRALYLRQKGLLQEAKRDLLLARECAPPSQLRRVDAALRELESGR